MILSQTARIVSRSSSSSCLIKKKSTEQIFNGARSLWVISNLVPRRHNHVLDLSAKSKDRFLVSESKTLVHSSLPYSTGNGDLPSHIKVALPALSPTMTNGTIISWEKKIGDKLAEGDLLCEIETDKASMGFETPEEGYLAQIFIQAGTRDVPIGKLLCIIVENEEDIEKFKDFKDDGSTSESDSPPSPPPVMESLPPKPASFSATPAPGPPKPPLSAQISALESISEDKKPFASPAAKKMAQERGIDLSIIGKGSGMDGMITTKDLDNVTPTSTQTSSLPPRKGFLGGMPTPMGEYTDTELSSMRATIAKRLQASKLEIPHYYLTVECEMDAVMKLRGEINKEYEKEGIKLSVNDFIIKATALASKRVPECNSAWMDTTIREYHTCDVSVAVDTGSGLITPIVTNAELKGLAEISESVKELAGRAKEGKLQPHEFMGGTITVSNLGMFDIEHFTAIINPPQACILAIGSTKKKVVTATKEPGQSYDTKHVMKVTLSCDHRVVDGAVGAKWLKNFKKFMEKPSSMLL